VATLRACGARPSSEAAPSPSLELRDKNEPLDVGKSDK
jgi:hypothetical protein